jgi:predicted metal-dependent hydrolase
VRQALRSLFSPKAPAAPPPEPTFDIDGRSVPVEVKTNPRARRVTLRADSTRGVIRLSLPPRASLRRALAMLETHRDWLAARVAAWPRPHRLEPGGTLLLEGETVSIDWSPAQPRTVKLDGASLRVGGPADAVPGRVERFLRARAKAVLTEETRDHATRLGKPVAAVTVRDTASRWGSCSATARIAYSWRLILAPPEVRRYVVAHEVAHLAHMDHSPAFWRTTASLYDGDMDAARRWLKRHGASLHWVGRG